MVTKEGETPGLGGARELGGRRKEEAEVIGVLVKNGQTTDKFTEEMVGKSTADSLLVTVRGKGSLEDIVDKILDLRGSLIKSDTACVTSANGSAKNHYDGITRVDVELGIRPSSKLIIGLNIALDALVLKLFGQMVEKLIDSSNGRLNRSALVFGILENGRVRVTVGRKTFVRSGQILEVQLVDQPSRCRETTPVLAPSVGSVVSDAEDSRVAGLGKQLSKVDGSVGGRGFRIILEEEAAVNGNKGVHCG